jgi:hypothetical protein
MSQAGFDWWQWILYGVGCWFAAWILVMLTRRDQGGGLSTIIGWVGGLAGAYCTGVGILQLIRWVLDRPNQ